jgi:hypothetical protein
MPVFTDYILEEHRDQIQREFKVEKVDGSRGTVEKQIQL